MEVKDLIIIGGGPGGYELAIHAGLDGKKVVLIEKAELGGTCLNHGCIPTKALYKNAEVIKTINHSNEFGVTVSNFDIDINKVQGRKEDVKDQLRKNIEQMLKKANVEFIKGTASFIDSSTVKVIYGDGEIELTANNFIIATGSVEKQIPIKGSNLNGVISSKELLDINNIPKQLVIIGGGVIGVEMATIFNQLGSEVTIVEYMKNLIPNIESDISSRLKTYLKKDGINVVTDAKVEEITQGENDLQVKVVTNKGKESILTCENVLVSVGRKSYFDNLNLETIGVEFDNKGIKVNDSYQTSVSNIYAVGDVIGGMMLAHTATFQSFAAYHHINNHENKTDFNIVPACVFTFPEIATVGLTEAQAKEQYGEVKTNKFLFRASGKAQAMGETDGFIKAIASVDGDLLGVHIIGPHASTIIHQAMTIINSKTKITDVITYVHAHPTLSEALLDCLRGLI